MYNRIKITYVSLVGGSTYVQYSTYSTDGSIHLQSDRLLWETGKLISATKQTSRIGPLALADYCLCWRMKKSEMMAKWRPERV